VLKNHAPRFTQILRAERDRNALGRLLEHYSQYLTLLARMQIGKRLQGKVDPSDLVQEVFLRALPRVRELRDASRFGSWLAAIARNLAIDYYRRSQTRPERTDDASDPDEQPAKSNVSSGGVAVEILDCIRILPEAYRETLILRLVEGMTGPEIAARTGMTEGSVRVNLHRGMKLLRVRMGVERDDV